MADTDLIDLLSQAATTLDEEAAWLMDMDMNDRGQQRPSIPARDRELFDALSEQAVALRALVELIQARQRS